MWRVDRVQAEWSRITMYSVVARAAGSRRGPALAFGLTLPTREPGAGVTEERGLGPNVEVEGGAGGGDSDPAFALAFPFPLAFKV
jgi:hypothetical protein